MAKNRKYKYLYFGIEACYAGSIAEVFKAPNMVTITAANNKESSYAAVMDRAVGTYLTNEFSMYWMDFMDENPDKTIDEMYTKVMSQTKGSHVTFYGDEKMKSLPIEYFFGTPSKAVNRKPVQQVDIIPTYLATKSTLKHMSESGNAVVAAKAKIALNDLIASQNKFRMTMTAISQQLEPALNNPLEQPCGKISSEYYEVLDYFTSKYGIVDGDNLPGFSVLVNLCNKHSVESIKAAIDAIC